MMLTIASVGPGDPELMNTKTADVLLHAGTLFLRTGNHPLASWLRHLDVSFQTMDDLYESSEDFEALSEAVARKIWEAAMTSSHLVYAVTDSMTDHTVDAVFKSKPDNCKIRMLPGFSFADYYLPACRAFFPTADIRICSAASFTESGYNPSRPILITELNDEITAGEVKNILSLFIRDEENILFLDEKAEPHSIPLFELDRQRCYNHLAAVAAGAFSYESRNRKTLDDLMQIMERLRSDDGCPWDRLQTHKSLKPYVVEEAWEVVDAISESNPVHLAEELGDLLFQVVFHVSIGKDFDEFTMDDVIGFICEKMIRRHPHVFRRDEKNIAGISSVSFSTETWDQIKQEENGSKTPADALSDVSAALPSLRYAEKVLRKLDRIPGFTPPSETEIASFVSGILSGITGHSKICPDNLERQLGSLLFSIVQLARNLKMDSEVLLHETVKRVIKTCQTLETTGNHKTDALKPLTFNDLGVY